MFRGLSACGRTGLGLLFLQVLDLGLRGVDGLGGLGLALVGEFGGVLLGLGIHVLGPSPPTSNRTCLPTKAKPVPSSIRKLATCCSSAF